jgi:hypothetical protein
VVLDRIPLDSPLWNTLSACSSAGNAVDLLRRVVANRELGQAWGGLCDEILHQGTVYQVSSAVIPHLVDVAPVLSTGDRPDLWIELGLLVAAGADHFPSPPAPGLQDGLDAALQTAQTRAVLDFVADGGLSPEDAGNYALACVALAGHRIGRAVWEFLSPDSGYVQVTCPRCGTDAEVDGFGDPLGPPVAAPEVGPATGRSPASWQPVADAISRLKPEESVGPGWADLLATGARVAAHGLPETTPNRAAWCLVSSMVATTSADAAPWARTLARLTGHFRCLDCGTVWAIADVLSPTDEDEPYEPEPVDLDRQAVLASVADAVAGFPAAPGHRLSLSHLEAEVRWRAEIGPVLALCTTPGPSPLVLAGTDDAVTMWDPRSGSPAGPQLPGPATAIATTPLPGGRVAVITADGSQLRWWDASTGQQLGASAAGASPILTLAAVPMPPANLPLKTVEWLAVLRDGRTMLASGHADGSVQLWDPATREPVRTLLHRSGQPAAAMTTVERAGDPRSHGIDLVTVHDGQIIEVWSTATVHGQPSTMAPDPRKLAAIGHRSIVAAAASPGLVGGHRPLLLADRNGLVSMWHTFGVRLIDPLPADPNHTDVIGMVTLTADDDDLTVVTASHTNRNLRLWRPSRGAATFIWPDIAPSCILHANAVIVVGHEHGLTALFGA